MSTIRIKLGDITKFNGDAIVNAANKTLLGGGGVDGAIHQAAGTQLLAECKTLHGCKTGEAKITKGYLLPAKYVIHTVGPIYSNSPSDPVKLAQCYVNSLNVALKNNIHTIAFPAISTGVYHYPVKQATKIAVKTVKEWIAKHLDYNLNVTFMCYDSKTEKCYQSELNSGTN